MSVPQIPGIKTESPLLDEFRIEVANLMQRNNTNFPGAQPVSFARHHIQELCNQEYVARVLWINGIAILTR